MKVQIFVDGVLVDTQIVLTMSDLPEAHLIMRSALKASLKSRAISISNALRSTFLIFDPEGRPVVTETFGRTAARGAIRPDGREV